MALHKAHQSVLDCIQAYWQDHAMSPTVQEIESRTRRSRGSIQNSLNRLKKEGFITWQKYKSRTIQLLNEVSSPVPEAFLDSTVLALPDLSQGLPIRGEIAAGYCHEPFTDSNDYLDINYAGRKPADYVLKISGDSMIGVGIPDGAYVGIRPVDKGYRPRPGEVVAVWVDGQGATLKHFFQKDSMVVLESANPKYAPMIFDLETTTLTVKGTHLFTHWQTAKLR
ncbi:MAG: S24 family peptidase [Cyanobacteria bacterium J06606_4]